MLFLGAAVVGASAAIYEVSGQEYPLIIGVGVGLYMMWAPLPALFYDRILAASQTQGTVVFLIFLSDWAGYVGTTGTATATSFWGSHVSRTSLLYAAAHTSRSMLSYAPPRVVTSHADWCFLGGCFFLGCV